MAIVLVLRDVAGNTRNVTVNAGDAPELQPGEVIDSVEGVDLSQVDINIEGGDLVITWPEGSITASGYAARSTASWRCTAEFSVTGLAVGGWVGAIAGAVPH